MPITKTKRKRVRRLAAELQAVEQLIDQAGDLQREIVAADEEIAQATAELRTTRSKKADELKSLLDRIEGIMSDGLSGEKSEAVVAARYVAELGKCKLRTEIVDKDAAFDLLKDDARALASFAIGDLRKYLTPRELALVLKEHHDGPRQLKIKGRQ